jgi:hypothetical protein
VPTIFEQYEYAQLAAAAYIDFGLFTSRDGLVGAQEAARHEIIPSLLAMQMFARDPVTNPDPWEVVDAYNNDAVGFHASLFGHGTEKVLAIAGTEPTVDGQVAADLFRADVGQIGFSGVAYSQAVSMINFILLLTADPGSEGVLQLDLVQDLPPSTEMDPDAVAGDPGVTGQYFTVRPRYDGVGLGGIKTGDTVTVTGHSLGGHLAAFALRLFPGLFQAAYTFNAPGFDPVTSSALSDEFVALFAPFLPPVPAETAAAGFAGLDDRLHTYESEDLAPGDDVSVVSSELITGTAATPEAFITTEENSHGIGQIIDSLALQSLFARMDAGFTDAKARTLFSAASADTANSQERLLEALHGLLLPGVDLPRDPQTGLPVEQLPEVKAGNLLPGFFADDGNFANRTIWYEAYMRVERAVLASPGLILESLADKSATGLAGLAKDGDVDARAYRYALKEGNPFALLGFDYAAHNGNGELDLYDPETGQGQLSEEWIADRARLLERMLTVNSADRDPGQNGYHRFDNAPDTLRLIDLETGFKAEDIRSGGSMLDGTAYAIFGGDGNDTTGLDGSAQADRLYGMAGDDRLDGDKGSDRLEGGAGADTLIGGTGDDTLLGGSGWDQYEFRSGDGFDTILDADGQGLITYDGIDMTGGDPVADRVWKQEVGEKTFWYLLVDYQENAQTYQRLTVQGPDGGVTILRWEAGQLGIDLLDGEAEETPPPVTTRTIAGDHEPEEFEENIAPEQPHGDDWVNFAVFNINYNFDPEGSPTSVASYDVRFNKIDDLGNYVPGASAAVADYLRGVVYRYVGRDRVSGRRRSTFTTERRRFVTPTRQRHLAASGTGRAAT